MALNNEREGEQRKFTCVSFFLVCGTGGLLFVAFYIAVELHTALLGYSSGGGGGGV